MVSAFLALAGCGASFLEGTIAPPYSSAWTKCGTTSKVRVKPPHSSVTISYTEPTTGTDGKPLKNLSHTTIYYNTGDGPVIAKVIPASQKSGGGISISNCLHPCAKPARAGGHGVCVSDR